MPTGFPRSGCGPAARAAALLACLALLAARPVPAANARAGAPLGLKVSPGLLAQAAAGSPVVSALVTVRPRPATAERPEADARRLMAAAVADVVAAYGPAGLTVRRRFSHLPIVAVTVPVALLDELAADPRVVAVTASRRLHALDSEGNALMHVTAVQAQGLTGKGIGIAILDTGVDDTHPELAPGGLDASAKTVRLYDAIDHSGDTSDHYGHGTAVAGIAAGSATGVAPGARVVAVRVLDNQGNGTTEQILDGINAVLASVAAGNPLNIRIANFSLGGYDPVEWPPNPGNCDAVAADFKAAFDELNAAGVTVVVAAGNGGCTNGIAFPACVSSAIAVGAVFDDTICTQPAPPPTNCLSDTLSYSIPDGCIPSCSSETRADRVTCYSDSGDRLDVWAPADCARAPRMGGGSWDCFGGTSAAAPYASGVVALLSTLVPAATPAVMRATLATTGTVVTDERNGLARPRVDALAAYTAFSACAAPATPGGVAVDTEEACEGQPVQLTWDPVSGAAGYTVQLAHDPAFAAVVATYHATDPHLALTLAGLVPFTAYLRVRADAACGAASPLSAGVSLTYGGACGTTGRQTTYALGIAHAPGVPPAFFYSDLAVLNLGDSTANLTLTFFGATGTPQVTAVLGSHQQVAWQDVLPNAFAVAKDDVGIVAIDSSAPVEVLTRTYSRPTDAPDRSYGQSIPGLRADQALTAGRVGYFMGLRSDNPFHAARPFRTNVLFANVGTVDADVEVRFFTNGGAPVATVSVTGIGPREQKQASLALPSGYASAFAEVRVSPAGAQVVGIASVVDGNSTDPTTIPLVIP